MCLASFHIQYNNGTMVKVSESARLVKWIITLSIVSHVGSQLVPPSAAGGDVGECSVCQDGIFPSGIGTPAASAWVQGTIPSCSNLQLGAQDLQNATVECDILQLTAYQAGCCEDFDSSQCTLCAVGSLPIEQNNRIVPSIGDFDVTCNDLAQNDTIRNEYMKQFLDTPGLCETTVLRRSAGYCGCPGVNVQCHLCDDGDTLLSDQVYPLTGTSCADIAYYVSLLSEDECRNNGANDIFEFDPKALCCPNMERPNNCTICSSDQWFNPLATASTELYGSVSCAVVQDAASLITSETHCGTLREEAGSQCCTDTPPPVSCELICPDGAPPPDPFKSDPVTGHSCESLAFSYSQLSEDQCQNAAATLGFDAVAFCCSNVSIPNQCPVCPSGQELLFPERVLFTYKEHSCQTIQESLRFVVGDGSTCQWYLDQSRAIQYCQCRPEIIITPSVAPAPRPNGLAGGGSGGSGADHHWPGYWLMLLLANTFSWMP